MGSDLPTVGKLGEGSKKRPFHSLVFAWSLAVCLVSSGGTRAAETAIQRDIGDYLMKAIQVCWNMPADTQSIARVQIKLNKDGSLAGPPKLLSPATPSPDKVAESAIRAITRCAPFPGLASYATHYDVWRDVILTFNPGDALSGHPKLDASDIDKLFEKYGKKTK